METVSLIDSVRASSEIVVESDCVAVWPHPDTVVLFVCCIVALSVTVVVATGCVCDRVTVTERVGLGGSVTLSVRELSASEKVNDPLVVAERTVPVVSSEAEEDWSFDGLMYEAVNDALRLKLLVMFTADVDGERDKDS